MLTDDQNPIQDHRGDQINEIVHQYFVAMERVLLRALNQAFSREKREHLRQYNETPLANNDTVPDLTGFDSNAAQSPNQQFAENKDNASKNITNLPPKKLK